MEIKEFIDRLKKNGAIVGLKRYKYTPYSMSTAVDCVTSIGKAITPDFVIDHDNSFVYENLIKYVHGDDTCQCIDPKTKKIIPADLKKGIYIAGPTGTGKTIALKVMDLYARIDDVQVTLTGKTPKDNFIFGATWRVDEICSIYAEEGKIDDFKKVLTLTINDLGAEPDETLFMGNRMNVLRQIIESRGDKAGQLLTFFTSNNAIIDDDNLKKYGDRAVSRLCQMCNYYEIKGKDRRK